VTETVVTDGAVVVVVVGAGTVALGVDVVVVESVGAVVVFPLGCVALGGTPPEPFAAVIPPQAASAKVITASPAANAGLLTAFCGFTNRASWQLSCSAVSGPGYALQRQVGPVLAVEVRVRQQRPSHALSRACRVARTVPEPPRVARGGLVRRARR
jgi:hypothetical protein